MGVYKEVFEKCPNCDGCGYNEEISPTSGVRYDVDCKTCDGTGEFLVDWVYVPDEEYIIMSDINNLGIF